jgi:hypothetical protein
MFFRAYLNPILSCISETSTFTPHVSDPFNYSHIPHVRYKHHAQLILNLSNLQELKKTKYKSLPLKHLKCRRKWK